MAEAPDGMPQINFEHVGELAREMLKKREDYAENQEAISFHEVKRRALGRGSARPIQSQLLVFDGDNALSNALAREERDDPEEKPCTNE